MSDNFEKSTDIIQTDLLNNIPDTYQKTVGFPVYDITRSFSMAESALYSAINKVYRLQDVNNLTGDDLTKYVLQRRGIIRHLATYAAVQLSVTGTGTVSKGSVFSTVGGIDFIADATTVITGSGTINLTCTQPGSLGNVLANTVSQIPVTLSGITFVTNALASAGGYDEEADAALISRYLLAVQTPPTSGNIYHYQQWALGCSGVGACKVYPLWNGACTVQVVIADANMLPADSTLVNQVQAIIDPGITGTGAGNAPIGAYCTITGALGQNINVSLTVSLLPNYVKSAVASVIQANIVKYLKTLALTQNYVSYAQIGACILASEGVLDYSSLTVNGGTSNVSITDKYVPVVGTVTVN